MTLRRGMEPRPPSRGTPRDRTAHETGGTLPPSGLLALGAVLRPALLPALDTHGVERAAHHVITDPGKVLHAAATDEHDRMLLQVVPHPGDVGRHLDAVRQPYARDLAQRGIRLLRRRGEDARADAPLLRAGDERRT